MLTAVPVDGAAVPTMAAVIQATADHFGHSVEELVGMNRAEPLVSHRMIAMYVCRELVAASYPSIANAFGGRDHTTAMHAVSRVAERMQADPQVRRQVLAVMEASRRQPDAMVATAQSDAITAALGQLRQWRALHARELGRVDTAIRALEALVDGAGG